MKAILSDRLPLGVHLKVDYAKSLDVDPGTVHVTVTTHGRKA